MGPSARDQGAELAEVAVPVPLRRTFTYAIPASVRERVHVGSQVKVPFGRRSLSGIVVGFPDSTEVPKLKAIAEVSDPELSLAADMLSLCRWVADYYLAPIGEVVRAALPAGLGKRSQGDVPRAEGGVSDITLGAEQANVLAALNDALAGRQPQTFVLYGVTGSGKTEVYLRAAERAVAEGGKALVLIPEIALSPQMVRRVEARFGSRVALWHSALTPAMRRRVWARTRRGEVDVLVGARSAVFAPLPDVRLIVVDEEHEGAYKQADSPRYHARDVALVRAREAGAVAVLGSATPSMETFAHASSGKYTLLRLPERVAGRDRAEVKLVPIPRHGKGKRALSTILGDPLHEAVAQTLSGGAQAILFLNRRGFYTIVQCESCKATVGCTDCDIVLTWHAAGNRLVCHYCGKSRPSPRSCPACSRPTLNVYKGIGTQRVEHELTRLYPNARVIRLDADSTRKRGSMESALDRFRDGEADILLGTQMVAKGLDFPRVTLVGVINADMQLSLPDFRSAERTFQLLTQVAGRSGRGDDPGEVYIQTDHAAHYALRSAAAQDYEAFYAQELAQRREPPYPPWRRLVNLLFDGKSEQAVIGLAESTADSLELAIADADLDVELLGPAPQPLSRLKGKHRWHLTLRGIGHKDLRSLAERALIAVEGSRGGVRLSVDVDPVSLL